MISIPISSDNGLFKASIDPETIQSTLQRLYSDEFNRFMASGPCCPFCGCTLHRHDACSRRMTVPHLQTIVILTIRRVYCPGCGTTHRVLPSFVIPGFQLSSCAADCILQLHAADESVSHLSNAAVSSSCAYRFIRKLKTAFYGILHHTAKFNDLYLISSASVNSYLKIEPDFCLFQVFQPNS